MAASSGDDGVTSELYSKVLDLQERIEATKQKVLKFIKETREMADVLKEPAENAKKEFEEFSQRFQEFLNQFFPSGAGNLDPSLLETVRQGIQDFAQERDRIDEKVCRDLVPLMIVKAVIAVTGDRSTERLESKELQPSSSVNDRPNLAAEATVNHPSPPSPYLKLSPSAAGIEARKKLELDDEDELTLEQLLESDEPLVLDTVPRRHPLCSSSSAMAASGIDNGVASKLYIRLLDFQEQVEATKQKVHKLMELSCDEGSTVDEQDAAKEVKMEFDQFNQRFQKFVNHFCPSGVQNLNPSLLEAFHQGIQYFWERNNVINLMILQLLAAREQDPRSTDLFESKELQASSSEAGRPISGNLEAQDLRHPGVRYGEHSSPQRNTHPKSSPATVEEIKGFPLEQDDDDDELTIEQLLESGEPLVQDTVPRSLSPEQQLQLDRAVAGWESLYKEHYSEFEQAFQQAREESREFVIKTEKMQARGVHTWALSNPGTIAVILIIAIAILAWKVGS